MFHYTSKFNPNIIKSEILKDHERRDRVARELASYTENEIIISQDALIMLIAKQNIKDRSFNCFILHEMDAEQIIQEGLCYAKEKKQSFRIQCLLYYGRIHYYAVDIRFHENGTYDHFIIDSFFAGCWTISDFPNLNHTGSKNRYLASGGGIQKDAVSCTLFALTQAIRASRQKNLYKILAKASNDAGLVDWLNLPPKYITNAQSWSFITDTLDIMIDEQRLPENHKRAFNSRRSPRNSCFDQSVSEGIHITHNGKVQNKSIKKIELIKETIQWLAPEYTYIDNYGLLQVDHLHNHTENENIAYPDSSDSELDSETDDLMTDSDSNSYMEDEEEDTPTLATLRRF